MKQFQKDEVVLYQGREVVILQADHKTKTGQKYTIKDGATTRIFVSQFALTKKEQK